MNSRVYIDWFSRDPIKGLFLLARIQEKQNMVGKCLGCEKPMKNTRAFTCGVVCFELFLEKHAGDIVEEFTE